MALSSLAQAFKDACEAYKRGDFAALAPMIHEHMVCFFIDDPLRQPLCGRTEFMAYCTQKKLNEPDTELEVPEAGIAADMQTGIVTGDGYWHDNNGQWQDNSGKPSGPHMKWPVTYRFQLTPVPGKKPGEAWLLISMYAKATGPAENP